MSTNTELSATCCQAWLHFEARVRNSSEWLDNTPPSSYHACVRGMLTLHARCVWRRLCEHTYCAWYRRGNAMPWKFLQRCNSANVLFYNLRLNRSIINISLKIAVKISVKHGRSRSTICRGHEWLAKCKSVWYRGETCWEFCGRLLRVAKPKHVKRIKAGGGGGAKEDGITKFIILVGQFLI